MQREEEKVALGGEGEVAKLTHQQVRASQRGREVAQWNPVTHKERDAESLL